MLLKPSNGLVSEPRSQTIVGRAGVEFCVVVTYLNTVVSPRGPNGVAGKTQAVAQQSSLKNHFLNNRVSRSF